ncbi:class I SAM-dependent methyltransferase [Trinickia terrae]|uniref:Class I SAM-dependent methyltransferase n=1 Tax=Trinickia terrae TaxID=2571161 RepID=A0A4U1I209_9BURK|nr:class I SAM-dependent methyltransferase [Trinickia terrae]TKC87188.1 class I SAM-dependent methyltransferase [Trinickia terrae]
MITDSTQRFTDRVADYVKYRPTYPREVVAFVRDACGLAADARIADIGAGTGISTKLFLDAGHPVVAVEPNDAMRRAADVRLAGHAAYRSVPGTAEATTLPDASVDLVIAAQAFHWFDPATAKREFARILKPGGSIALFWNFRRVTGSPFLDGYEALLRRYSVDYAQVADRYPGDDWMAAWFGENFVKKGTFDNVQRLDFDGLKGRLASSSYAPKPGHPSHEPMLAALRELFDKDAQDGRVDLVYDTFVYVGRPAH